MGFGNSVRKTSEPMVFAELFLARWGDRVRVGWVSLESHRPCVSFRFNSIQALSEASFAGLTKLELLMLHGNNIPTIPDGVLRDLGSLQVQPGVL